MSADKTVFAKNGARICSVNGIRLHSAYDPQKEAERFIAKNLEQSAFIPSLVVITEPALSYAADSLAVLLPRCVTCAIRYCRQFDSSNSKWSAVIYADDGDLAEALFDRFGEEMLCSSLFLSWEASERAFPEKTRRVWQSIKTTVSKARDVLATREYFSERWLKNIVRFCLFVQKPVTVRRGEKPVLIAASGFSLQKAIPFIKEHRNDFFLIAVSSALAILFANGIDCDLCVTTDGGFWAKELLRITAADASGRFVAACSAESALPACFGNNLILPLTYGEHSAEEIILKKLKIPALGVMRNGTVSGTALFLAKEISSGPVFFCGLDLAGGKGYLHAQPHAREIRERTFDTRLFPLAARQAMSAFNAEGSLNIYRNWFLSRAGSKNFERVFRIAHNDAVHEPLGLTDISPADFSAAFKTQTSKESAPVFIERAPGLNKTERAQKLQEIIVTDIALVKKGKAPDVFSVREVFPAYQIQNRHEKNTRRDARDSRVSEIYIERMGNLLALAGRLAALSGAL